MPLELASVGARQCHRLSRARGAFHRRRPRERPCESSTGALPRWPAGQPPHAFIDVREHRLDRRAVHSRERPGGRVRSYGFCRSNVSTSTPMDHSNIPDRRVCVRGDCPVRPSCLDRRAITEWALGQGQRNTVPRRSPRRLLVAETSPQPGPPSGASCRGHRPFTLPGAARGEGDTAFARQ